MPHPLSPKRTANDLAVDRTLRGAAVSDRRTTLVCEQLEIPIDRIPAQTRFATSYSRCIEDRRLPDTCQKIRGRTAMPRSRPLIDPFQRQIQRAAPLTKSLHTENVPKSRLSV